MVGLFEEMVEAFGHRYSKAAVRQGGECAPAAGSACTILVKGESVEYFGWYRPVPADSEAYAQCIWRQEFDLADPALLEKLDHLYAKHTQLAVDPSGLAGGALLTGRAEIPRYARIEQVLDRRTFVIRRVVDWQPEVGREPTYSKNQLVVRYCSHFNGSWRTKNEIDSQHFWFLAVDFDLLKRSVPPEKFFS